jgi:cell shape-determining protein MreC
MEEVLKQTNQSLKNTNIRMANLQVELQATQKQYTRVLLLLKEVVYDPQAIRFDEASVLDHIFTNGKTK